MIGRFDDGAVEYCGVFEAQFRIFYGARRFTGAESEIESLTVSRQLLFFEPRTEIGNEEVFIGNAQRQSAYCLRWKR